MKKAKKIIALAIGVVMSASVFAGCSANGLELYNGFSKQQNIKSYEMKTEVLVNISGKNLSTEEEKGLKMLPIKDGIKITTTTKYNGNEDKTINKSQSEISADINNMQFNMGVWTDMNLSGDKPSMRTIISIPDIAKTALPQFNGKDYMVMDSLDMNSIGNDIGQPPIDYKKIMDLSKNLQPKLIELMKAYVNQYNFNKNIITKSEKQNILVGGKQQEVNIYDIKLSDSTLKELLKYTVTNLGDNKAAIEAFVKDYLTVMGVPSQLPSLTGGLNSSLDAIKDIKILGDKGLNIQYAINKDGYIVNEKGDMDFVFDTAVLKNSLGSKSGQGADLTGIYTVTLGFNVDRYSINENVQVELPKLTSANSVDYIDLIKSSIGADKKDDAKLTPLDIAYKESFNNVKGVVAIASAQGVKPYYFKVEDSLEVGSSSMENVVAAANNGLQSIINEGRESINKLPDSLLQQKRTLSSILDNYQHPIYETTVNLINKNKSNPKQSEIILGRQLINDIPAYYKTSYSSALDEEQQILLNKAYNLVNKASESKNQQDIENAKASINELKTIPVNFAGEGVLKFIANLEGRLK